MQNPPPKPLSPLFKDAAKIEESQRIRLGIERLNSPRAKAGFRDLVERQERALQAIQERLERQREETTKAITRDLLDQSIKQQSPHLRPRHLPGLWRSQLEKDARRDAACMVAKGEERQIAQATDGFLREQQRFLDSAASRQRCAQRFNNAAASGNARESSHTKSTGRGR